MVDVRKSLIALAISPLTVPSSTPVSSAVPMFRIEGDDFTQTDAATAGARCMFKSECADVYASKDYKKFYLATENERGAMSNMPIKAEDYGAFYKRMGCLTPPGVKVSSSDQKTETDGTFKQGTFTFACDEGYEITGTGVYYSSLTCNRDGRVTYPLNRSCVSAAPVQPKQSALTDYAVPPPLGIPTYASQAKNGDSLPSGLNATPPATVTQHVDVNPISGVRPFAVPSSVAASSPSINFDFERMQQSVSPRRFNGTLARASV
jgi:hypothetical protein